MTTIVFAKAITRMRLARLTLLPALAFGFLLGNASTNDARATAPAIAKVDWQSHIAPIEIGTRFKFRAGGSKRFGAFRGSRFGVFRGRGFKRFGAFRGHRFGNYGHFGKFHRFRGHRYGRFH